MSRAVSAEVLGVLERVEVEDNRLRIVDALDRGLYVQVNKVLAALGGAWDRRARAHVFQVDPREAIDQVLADGTFTDARKEYDFFRTPHRLAESLVTRRASNRATACSSPRQATGASRARFDGCTRKRSSPLPN
jgi:hypothetical protein